MKELCRSNDPVFLSWATAVLKDAGITAILLDQHTSILEGSIGAIPRRLMVIDEDLPTAQRVLKEMAPEPDGAEETSREQNQTPAADPNSHTGTGADAETGADGTSTFGLGTGWAGAK